MADDLLHKTCVCMYIYTCVYLCIIYMHCRVLDIYVDELR